MPFDSASFSLQPRTELARDLHAALRQLTGHHYNNIDSPDEWPSDQTCLLMAIGQALPTDISTADFWRRVDAAEKVLRAVTGYAEIADFSDNNPFEVVRAAVLKAAELADGPI
jgi:hypothetical protein